MNEASTGQEKISLFEEETTALVRKIRYYSELYRGVHNVGHRPFKIQRKTTRALRLVLS